MVTIPTRDVLAIVSHGDQRMVRWFEDAQAAFEANGVGDMRPPFPGLGQQHYDTTLLQPIWFNGTIWTDAAGLAV